MDTNKHNARIQVKSKLGALQESDYYDLYTTGVYTEKNGSYYIRYNDETLKQEPSSTTIKVTEDRLVIMRSGENESHLVIEKDKRSEGHYVTPVGSLLVGINNGKLNNRLSKQGGELDFSYDLDMNGKFVARNEISINIKINA